MKVIHGAHHSPGFRKRFKREVDLAAKVRGLYTAEVIDADPHGKQPWMAFEYVPGTTLHDAVNDAGTFSPQSVRILGAGLAEALRAIHESGVLHRDLKPANIVLTVDHGPRVIDFGIAKAIDHRDPASAASITHPGTLLGTLHYMAPEQVRGEELSPKSDIFALGGVLYFTTTGRPPFWNSDQDTLKDRIQNEEPDIEALTSFRALILQCLEKDPEQHPTLEKIQERFGRVSITENASLLPSEARHRIVANQRALRSWDNASRTRGEATDPGTKTGHPSSHSTIKEGLPPTEAQSEDHRKPTSDDPKEIHAPFPVSLVAGCAAILLAVPLFYTLMGWLGLSVATWARTRFESAAGLDIPTLISWAAVPYSF